MLLVVKEVKANGPRDHNFLLVAECFHATIFRIVHKEVSFFYVSQCLSMSFMYFYLVLFMINILEDVENSGLSRGVIIIGKRMS